MPCQNQLNQIKVLMNKLNLVYKNKLKKQPQELFDRKTFEANTLLQYADVKSVMDQVELDLPGNLAALEEHLSSEGSIDLLSESVESSFKKTVSHASTPIRSGTTTANPSWYLLLQVSKWWRKATCGLAVKILRVSKHRSGVACNMLLAEWDSRKT